MNKEINFGVLNSSTTTIYKFDDRVFEETRISNEEVEDIEVDLLYVANDVNLANETLPHNTLVFPIQDEIQTNIESKNTEELARAITKTESTLVLKKNLETIAQLPQLADELKTLWRNDRYGFIESLWSLIKQNHNPHELTISFHDILAEDENKLTFSIFSGIKKGNYQQGNEAYKQLIATVANSEIFSVIENDNGKWCIFSQVDSSPILLLGKSSPLTRLNIAILEGIIRELNR